MRRFMVLVTVVMVMAAMMVIAGPASADAGCQAFGNLVKTEAIEEGPQAGDEFDENVVAGAQEEGEEGADDDVNFLKDLSCV